MSVVSIPTHNTSPNISSNYLVLSENNQGIKSSFFYNDSFILVAEASGANSDSTSNGTIPTTIGTTSNGEIEIVTQNVESTLATTSDTAYTPSLDWGDYFQAIGIIFFLLLAFWYGAKLLKNNFRGRFSNNELPNKALTIEASLPLGANKGIYVVRFLNKYLVLGVSEQNINLLLETNIENGKNDQEFQSIIQESINSSTQTSYDPSCQSSDNARLSRSSPTSTAP